MHKRELETIGDPRKRFDRLVELNVAEQVQNLAQTSIIQRAWHGRSGPILHGWVYDVGDGLLRDLGMCVAAENEIPESYTTVLATIEAPK